VRVVRDDTEDKTCNMALYGTSVAEGRALGVVLGVGPNTLMASVIAAPTGTPTPTPTLTGIEAIVCCPCFVYKRTCSQQAQLARKEARLITALSDDPYRMWVKHSECLQSLARVTVVVTDADDVLTHPVEDFHDVGTGRPIVTTSSDDRRASRCAPPVRGDAFTAIALGRSLGVATVVTTSRDIDNATAIAIGVFGEGVAGSAASGVLLASDLETMHTPELIDTIKMHVALNGGLVVAAASPKTLLRIVQVCALLSFIYPPTHLLIHHDRRRCHNYNQCWCHRRHHFCCHHRLSSFRTNRCLVHFPASFFVTACFFLFLFLLRLECRLVGMSSPSRRRVQICAPSSVYTDDAPTRPHTVTKTRSHVLALSVVHRCCNSRGTQWLQ
jgi:hypothetical protein